MKYYVMTLFPEMIEEGMNRIRNKEYSGLYAG